MLDALKCELKDLLGAGRLEGGRIRFYGENKQTTGKSHSLTSVYRSFPTFPSGLSEDGTTSYNSSVSPLNL